MVVRCLYSQTHTSLSDVLNKPATNKSLKWIFIALRYAQNIFNIKNDGANFMLIYAYLVFCRLDLRKTEEMSFIASLSFIHPLNANIYVYITASKSSTTKMSTKFAKSLNTSQVQNCPVAKSHTFSLALSIFLQ